MDPKPAAGGASPTGVLAAEALEGEEEVARVLGQVGRLDGRLHAAAPVAAPRRAPPLVHLRGGRKRAVPIRSDPNDTYTEKDKTDVKEVPASVYVCV